MVVTFRKYRHNFDGDDKYFPHAFVCVIDERCATVYSPKGTAFSDNVFSTQDDVANLLKILICRGGHHDIRAHWRPFDHSFEISVYDQRLGGLTLYWDDGEPDVEVPYLCREWVAIVHKIKKITPDELWPSEIIF